MLENKVSVNGNFCTIKWRKNYGSDPVLQDVNTGLWYFMDEIWVEIIGPYMTEEECDKACNEYARNL